MTRCKSRHSFSQSTDTSRRACFRFANSKYEVGVARDVRGAVAYMDDFLGVCGKLGKSTTVFAFRKHRFDAWDYELGQDKSNKMQQRQDYSRRCSIKVHGGNFPNPRGFGRGEF